jgi:hypothetical protein
MVGMKKGRRPGSFPFFHVSTGPPFGDPYEVVEENAFWGMEDENLLTNTYDQTAFHSWLLVSEERILEAGGFGGYKTTENLEPFDPFGRPSSIVQTYDQLGEINIEPTYSDAGLVLEQSVTIAGPQTIAAQYEFLFDDILRPTQTRLNINQKQETLSSLWYNDQDQVKIKYLGRPGTEGAFLQQVDYYYDPSGRLIAINSPQQTGCFETQCSMEAEILLDLIDVWGQFFGCRHLEAIHIDGQVYEIEPAYDVLDPTASVAWHINQALDFFGLPGEASQDDEVSASSILIKLSIAYTNAGEIKLVFNDCSEPIAFEVTECCYEEPVPVQSGPEEVNNPDLFYELLTYEGIDISRIELGGGCAPGDTPTTASATSPPTTEKASRFTTIC